MATSAPVMVLDCYTEVQQALKPSASVAQKTSPRPGKRIILLLGGFTQARKGNDKMWKIDLSTGTCEIVASIGHGALKFEHGFCSTPEKMFFIGGSSMLRDNNDLPATSNCHALAVMDAQWEAWPDMDEPVTQTVAVCVNDHIYTFGGDSTEKAVYRLNLKTRKWSRCPDMPVENLYPLIAAIGCMVYMIYNTNSFNKRFRTSDRVTMFCFDTSTLTWTPLTPLPVSINNTCNAKAVSVGEDLYLVGGSKQLCARYSTPHKTWKTLESPKVIHLGFAAVHMDGEIVLCGGDGKYTTHGIIEVYNIAQDAWKEHSVQMPMELNYHHCVVYDEETGKIVVPT